MALRSRLDDLLRPEADPEPVLRYREGLPALSSFLAFVLLIAPIAALVFAMTDSANGPTWILPLAIGVPAFGSAFLLPRRRRRQVALLVATVDAVLVLIAVALVVLYLIAKANCPPDAYECPF